MNRQIIADDPGLTVETISRGLGALVRSGVVDVDHTNSVRLHTTAALRHIADGN
jgi:hypothetical protein